MVLLSSRLCVSWILPCTCASILQAESFLFDDDLELTVPDGFTVERVAGPPLVDRPIMADIDDSGRLYVAESSGSNDNVETQLRDKPHRVLCLEDRDTDGHYEHRTVFADQLMLPEGVLCYQGSVYVSAPPVIWKLTDTTGDGLCDLREIWHDGKTLTGCANDLHGPYLGRDGWIYWCKGGFAEQTYQRPNEPVFVSRAAHIFRKHPDSDLVEPVITGGMDNPVEVAFSPSGERFFTTTFLQHPAGGNRDGIIHAIYGGVYGKDHDVIANHPRTGGLMPIMTHMGPAAACGLMHVESNALGTDFQGNLFATAFNLRKITRHQLTPTGATFTSQDSDFLVANQMDFHPTDILEDGDGSLLVIDTGGWYKLCCPTSQLHKPDALGAIYRIRKTSHPTIEDPYGHNIDWNQQHLTPLLKDPRALVRKHAIEALSQRGNASIAPLLTLITSPSEPRRVVQDALWALTRIHSSKARAAARPALSHPDPHVRQTALHAIAIHRDASTAEQVTALLKDSNAAVQRSAAEALGRLRIPSSHKPLTKTLTETTGRVLEHSIIYALIKSSPNDLLEGLQGTTAQARATLIALDQSQHTDLEIQHLLPFLSRPEATLQQTAWDILTRHPEWSDLATPALMSLLESPRPPQQLATLLAAWPHVKLISYALQSDIPTIKQIGHRALIETRQKRIPNTWLQAIEAMFESDPNTALQILRSKEPTPSLESYLNALIDDPQSTNSQRLQAMLLVSKLEPEQFPWVITQTLPSQTANHRSQALQILAKHIIPATHINTLTKALRTIGPMEFGSLVEILAPHLNDTKQAKASIAAFKANPLISNLPPARLTPFLQALPESVNNAKTKLVATFQAKRQTQAAKLESLLVSLPKGDVVRGQAIFNGNRAACATCHQIGYVGGTLGPDLTKIGTIRSRRDLLESIIFPSASYVRSYETVMVTLKGNQHLVGILKQDSDQQITLATGPTNESTVARADVIAMIPATHSLMPSGLDASLTKAELGDLLAFLQNTKSR